MKNKYNVFLFDLDGTITDSAPGIMNSIRYALDKMGEPIPEEAVLRKFIGPPLWQSFEEFCGLSKEKAEYAVKCYREYYKDNGIFENSLYPGVEEFIKSVKASGKEVYLATSKPTIFANRILEYFDILKYFDGVVGSNLDGTMTDKAEIIDAVLKMTSEKDLSRIIMFGDRNYDVIGAHKNGIACVGVLFGFGSREELSEAGAEYIVEGL